MRNTSQQEKDKKKKKRESELESFIFSVMVFCKFSKPVFPLSVKVFALSFAVCSWLDRLSSFTFPRFSRLVFVSTSVGV